MTEELDKLDDDYTAKKVSYDNLPTFKRDMKERYDQVPKIVIWWSLARNLLYSVV